MQTNLKTALIVDETTETDIYRIVVIDTNGLAVLLNSVGSTYSLPILEVGKCTRAAEEITSSLRRLWNGETVLLFTGLYESERALLRYAVLEARHKFSPYSETVCWFPVHHAIDSLLRGSCQAVLRKSYSKVNTRRITKDSEPFSRLGWSTRLTDWVQQVISPLGMTVVGFGQLNGGETFSLIRFETDHHPVWFKAVGEPNLREYTISQALARMFPGQVPAILATRPDWHGWLMADASGAPIRETQDPEALRTAVEELMNLQFDSIGRTVELRLAGCRDLRVSALLSLVDPFLEAMACLMNDQTKISPPVVRQEDFVQLGQALKDALSRLGSLAIPDTLGHADFNLGNIIAEARHCTFIDWAEAYIGNPFLTFEYLGLHLRKESPELASLEPAIRRSYSSKWQSVLTSGQITEGFSVIPLIAAFAYATASDSWRDVEKLRLEGLPSYFRSLTRRMKREADILAAQGNRRKRESLDHKY